MLSIQVKSLNKGTPYFIKQFFKGQVMLILILLQRLTTAAYPHNFEPPNLSGLVKNYTVVITYKEGENLIRIAASEIGFPKTKRNVFQCSLI